MPSEAAMKLSEKLRDVVIPKTMPRPGDDMRWHDLRQRTRDEFAAIIQREVGELVAQLRYENWWIKKHEGQSAMTLDADKLLAKWTEKPDDQIGE